MTGRKDILLKAAFDLFKKQERSGYVINILCETAYYDGTDCDGYCLMDDIATELEIDND